MTDNDIQDRGAAWRDDLRKAMTAKQRADIPRVEMPMLDGAYRVTCNEEVNQGLSLEQAQLEATRCLDCPNPTCVEGCPVGIHIPDFIKNIQRGNMRAAAAILKSTVHSRLYAVAFVPKKNNAKAAASIIR